MLLTESVCHIPFADHCGSDKALECMKNEAHSKFQEVAFAYAVLSDPIRRKRYDATGSTSESVDFDGFSWTDFYQEQFKDVVTSEAIEQFSKGYKNSVEEKDDVLSAYEKFKGKWHGIYATVMLSDPLEDEDRFRGYIDEAIENNDVQPYKAYTDETDQAKERRKKEARREGKEAMEYAEKLGVKDKLFGKDKGDKGESSEGALAALIQKKHAGRSNFLADLEARYTTNSKKSKGKKGKKRASEDEAEDDDGIPSEEAFQAAAARLKNSKSGGEVADGRKAKRTKR
jgi:DnaJ family protein C protein 9